MGSKGFLFTGQRLRLKAAPKHVLPPNQGKSTRVTSTRAGILSALTWDNPPPSIFFIFT